MSPSWDPFLIQRLWRLSLFPCALFGVLIDVVGVICDRCKDNHLIQKTSVADYQVNHLSLLDDWVHVSNCNRCCQLKLVDLACIVNVVRIVCVDFISELGRIPNNPRWQGNDCVIEVSPFDCVGHSVSTGWTSSFEKSIVDFCEPSHRNINYGCVDIIWNISNGREGEIRDLAVL